AFLGFASHGLLDACTSYGTQLLFPFSNMRVAWDVISIIDPLFTIPLVVLIVLSRIKKSPRWAWAALAYSFCYMGLGWIQRDRALEVVRDLAAKRSHTPLRVQAKPSIGNLILYRGLYEVENHFYADAIRVPFFGAPSVYEGGSLEK